MEKNKTTKLHLGCGNRYLDGYTNVDMDPLTRADDYVDLNQLPWHFKSETFNEILCAQVIEHLNISITDFLKECYRVLKIDGQLQLEFPNAFFWRYRFDYMLGKAKGSFWAPFHTKLIHPYWVEETMKVMGFDVKTKKNGLFFLPRSLSEQNIVLLARKRR